MKWLNQIQTAAVAALQVTLVRVVTGQVLQAILLVVVVETQLLRINKPWQTVGFLVKPTVLGGLK